MVKPNAADRIPCRLLNSPSHTSQSNVTPPSQALTMKSLKLLTLDEVIHILNSPQVELSTYCDLFLKKKITGKKLGMCEDSDLEMMGIDDAFDRRCMLKLIAGWNDKGVDSSLLL